MYPTTLRVDNELSAVLSLLAVLHGVPKHVYTRHLLMEAAANALRVVSTERGDMSFARMADDINASAGQAQQMTARYTKRRRRWQVAPKRVQEEETP